MPLPSDPGTARSSDSFRRHAFERLYEAIYDGTFTAGEAVSEEELARWLEVSRQPLRYALLRLEQYGLVELLPGRQPRILGVDERRLNQLFVLRGMFLNRTLPRVVPKLSDVDLATLERHMDEIRAGAAAGAWAWMTEALFELFAVLVDADGNRVISERLRRTQYELTDFLRPSDRARFDPGVFIAQVQTLVDAARSREPASMRAAIRAITDDTFERYRTQHRSTSV